MKKLALLLAFILALPSFGAAEECFMVLAGRGATADGSVLLGHNEDNEPRALVRLLSFPRQVNKDSKAMRRLDNGIEIPEPDTVWARWMLEMPGRDFSHGLLNEKGVAVFSDNCPSREDKPDLVQGGISACLRLIVAERAASARDGARLVGELVGRYGYNQSGRTLAIADSREGWMVAMVNGRHWVARRVPDDKVALLANSYAMHEVDLGDSLNYMGSPDIIDYAVSRGWYDPARDGAFDFEKAYAQVGRRTHPNQTHRQWSGINILAPGASPLPEDSLPLPFAVSPAHPLTPADIFRVLRDHYEGTPYAQGSPPHAEDYPGPGGTICNGATNSGSVFQLREGLPVAAGPLWWLALGRPCSAPFVPLYPWALMAVPAELQYDTKNENPKLVETKPQMNKALGLVIDWDSRLDAAYSEKHKSCVEQCQAFEAAAFAVQGQNEALALSVWEKNPERARKLLSSFSQERLKAALSLVRMWNGK